MDHERILWDVKREIVVKITSPGGKEESLESFSVDSTTRILPFTERNFTSKC
jgi:hypothetical protein